MGLGRDPLGGVADWIERKRGKEAHMANELRDDKPASEPEPKESRKPALAGLAIAAVLLVVGWWLARELTAASKMQDCLMSGRTNCNQIQPQ
jgi:hypothetical protein